MLIPLVWFTVKGFRKGLIIELATLAALIGGIYVAYFFSDFTATIIHRYFDLCTSYLHPISFIITFVIVIILVFMLARFLDAVVETVCLGFLNKLAGAVFAFLKTAVILGFIIYHIAHFDSEKKIISGHTRQHALTFKPLVGVTTTVLPVIKNIKSKAVECVNDSSENEIDEDVESS